MKKNSWLPCLLTVLMILSFFGIFPAKSVWAVTNFCTKKISFGNCQSPFQPIAITDLKNDTNGGCPSGMIYHGCIDNFSGSQVCCGPDTGGKIPCPSGCSESCAAGQIESPEGWCEGGKKCCKTPSGSTSSPGQTAVSCSFGTHPTKGICVPKDKDYTKAKCTNLRDMAQSPLGKSSEVTCPDGKTMCCIVDPAWKPAADTPATPAKKPPAEYKLTNPLGTTSIPVILGRIIKTFLGIVGALALAVFVYGGLMWMTARGDASQVKKGQDALKNATIGLFLIMFSYTLTASIATFLTSEQKEIAAQEGRGTTESETVKGGDVTTLQGQLDAGKDAVVQGQGAAAAAGAEAGISTPGPAAAIDMCKKSYPENSIDYVECVEGATGQQGLGEAVVAGGVVAGWLGTGQSTYNTPTPNAGQTGGQKDCKYAEDPDKCSTIGWKTVCNQKVFDTGYGTYNNLGCYSPGDCQPGTVLSDDCAQAVAIITSAVTSIPGLNLGGCMSSAVGVGKECQKSNQLCCKKK